MARHMLISRVALAVALAGAAVTAPPALAAKKDDAAAKLSFSPGFQKAAADIDKALDTPSAAVTAASEKAKAAQAPADKQAADAEVDTALGGGKAKVDAAVAAATTPGDKLKAGDLVRKLGNAYDDPAMQHRGFVMMLDSGAAAPTLVPQLQWLAGVTAYQSGDYAEAVKYIKPAKDAGYKDSQGLIDRVLADSYQRSGNSAAAADVAMQEIASARAAGTKPSETALRSALQSAYDAKDLAKSVDLGTELVRDYPSASAWNAAISVVRQLAALPGQDNLDLMRLMARTGSMMQRTDYLEYIQNADPRRSPGEALKAMDAGVASGKLQASDSYVVEMRGMANGRLAADKASLPSLEHDSLAPSATANTAAGAGDAFLSYDQAVKAEELYKVALTKPGADKNRVLTRLGIAQVDQGKYADAQQSFTQVAGPRASIAKLWLAYIAGKQAGGGAAPAPATAG